MDAANFLYRHAAGPIYGWFSPRGLQRLRLPGPGGSGARIHLLHSAANLGWGQALGAALHRYFAGLREDFGEVPLDLDGATAFQRRVYAAARGVPWGGTATYGELARRLGRTAASARAVGQALGRNPIPIVIPCHRFVAAGGALGGFSAGLDWKRELLRLEGNSVPGH